MQLNTEEGLRAGRLLHEKYGSWPKVREALKLQKAQRAAEQSSEPERSELNEQGPAPKS